MRLHLYNMEECYTREKQSFYFITMIYVP